MSHALDGVVALSGCDKTIPATVMALARIDVPGLVLYGGPIAPGRFEGKDVTIQDVFEAVGAHAAGSCRASGSRVLEDTRVSRRGRVRRPVHREHDERRAHAARHVADGRERGRRDRSAKHDVARECGALVMELIATMCGRARCSRALRSTTRSPRSPRRRARRTRCCTCSRSPTRRASRSRSTTSMRSPRARRCSRISSRAVGSPRST